MTTSHSGAHAAEDRAADVLRSVQGAIIWESDALGLEFKYVGDAADELLGISPEQWRREHDFLKQHVHRDDWRGLLEAMHLAAAEGGVHTCEHRMLRGDGSMMWAQTSV